MGLKRRLFDLVAPYPRLFHPLARVWLTGDRSYFLVAPDTEILIAGFPRSANSYAVVAFREAQGRAMRIAHHLHAEAEVLRAVSLGIPAIVVLRRPEEAIRSLAVAEPETDASRALARWTAFYQAVERVADRVVISDFSLTTGNFGPVVDAVNEKFGTAFLRPGDTAEARAHVIATLEREQDEAGDARFAVLPGDERAKMLAAVRLDFDTAALERATDLYRRLASLAPASSGPEPA